jgi:hypothetical protein
MVMPLARTPQSDKMARSQKQYADALFDQLEDMTPWQVETKKKSKVHNNLASLRKKVPSGTVMVIPDGNSGEAGLMDTLYRDATILKE